MSFYSEAPIKAVRKARRCEGCSQTINAGEPAVKCTGNEDGFWSATYHHDCRKAEVAFNYGPCDFQNYDDWTSLSDIERDDWPWLIREFPAVATRMGINIVRFAMEAANRRRRFATALANLAALKEDRP